MTYVTEYDDFVYWEYTLLYIDDGLVLSENGEDLFHKEFGKYFEHQVCIRRKDVQGKT